MSNSSPGSPKYASPWRRLVAFLVDLPVLFLLAWVSRALFAQFEGMAYLSCWIYFAAMESSGLQATLGKKALGLKVADLEGNRVGFLRASGRYWGKLVSVISLGAGFAVMFFTERHQAFHDYVAGCVVVDQRGSPQEALPRLPEEPH